MNAVVAIGDTHDLKGFALVGVSVVAAGTDAEVTDAWQLLEAGTGLVILSAAAAATLHGRLDERPDLLTVVMP